VIPDMLIYRDSFCPSCGRIRSTLDVPRKKFYTGQKATDASHVTIAVSLDAIANTMQSQHPVLEFCQWLKNSLELKVFP
jgi:hypothetical protein